MYIHSFEIWKNERNKGHFIRLLETLWSLGFTIKVYDPTDRTCEELKDRGFIETTEQNPDSPTPDLVIVMVKEPPQIEACEARRGDFNQPFHRESVG